jgi:hypothetical protein
MAMEGALHRSLGSARASRAGDGALASANFLFSSIEQSKACFGEAPKPAREARALPANHGHLASRHPVWRADAVQESRLHGRGHSFRRPECIAKSDLRHEGRPTNRLEHLMNTPITVGISTLESARASRVDDRAFAIVNFFRLCLGIAEPVLARAPKPARGARALPRMEQPRLPNTT